MLCTNSKNHQDDAYGAGVQRRHVLEIGCLDFRREPTLLYEEVIALRMFEEGGYKEIRDVAWRQIGDTSFQGTRWRI